MSDVILFKHNCGTICDCHGVDIWCPKCKVGTTISNGCFSIVELKSISYKQKKYFNSGQRLGRKQGVLEVWNEVRKLMKPLPSNTKKEDLWIAGSFKTPEEFVLVNLRQKVLRRIDKLESKKVGREK